MKQTEITRKVYRAFRKAQKKCDKEFTGDWEQTLKNRGCNRGIAIMSNEIGRELRK